MKKLLPLLLFILSLNLAAQTNINWGMTMNVSSNTYGNMHPRMVMNAAGQPLVIWGRGSDMSVYFSRWNGTAFTTPVKLNPAWMMVATQSWHGPDIASKGDTVYVVMKEAMEADTASHIYLVRSFDGGMTFSAPYQVDNIYDSISRFPTVTVDNTGNPLVAFMKFEPTFGDARWVVSRSTNYGTTFSLDKKASGWSGLGSTVCDCCPGGITTANSKVAMMYRDAFGNIRDSWIGLSVNNGSNFTSGWNMDQNNWMLMMCPSTGPDGVTIGDSLYSVFMNGDSGNDMVYWSRTSLTSMVSQPAMLTANIANTYQNYPRIDTYNGAMAIVWKQNTNGNDILGFRFTNDISMGLDPGFDTVDLANVTNTDVALSLGTVFVVWQDDNSATVRYRRGTFSALNVTETTNDEPQVSIYPNPSSGNIEVVSNEIIERIEIFNSLGARLFTDLPTSKYSFIRLKETAGVYFLRIHSEDGSILTKKVILQ